MELHMRAAKWIYKKDSHKGIADRSSKRNRNFRLQKGVVNRNCRKEPPNAIAKRMTKRPVMTTKQDCFWPPCYWDLHFSLLLMEACFEVS